MTDDIVTRLRDIASRCWCAEKSQGEPVGKPFFRCESCDDQLRAATEVERLRAAIDALLTDIDSDHRPVWPGEAKATGKQPWCCAWCDAADGGWPCVHRRALDELKEARRG